MPDSLKIHTCANEWQNLEVELTDVQVKALGIKQMLLAQPRFMQSATISPKIYLVKIVILTIIAAKYDCQQKSLSEMIFQVSFFVAKLGFSHIVE